MMERNPSVVIRQLASTQLVMKAQCLKLKLIQSPGNQFSEEKYDHERTTQLGGSLALLVVQTTDLHFSAFKDLF